VSARGKPDPAENPFSTRHVRPGAIAYQFPPGKTLRDLVDRLRRNRWLGQIVGPHGSGKSTLVATLLDALGDLGRHTVLIELHEGQRSLPVRLRGLAGLAADSVVVVDGYEQLGLLRRLALRRVCRRNGLGLVVTSHASCGFPDLFRTATSPPLAQRIVETLVAGDGPIAPSAVRDRFVDHQGDLREMLFDLYDLWESFNASRAGTAGTASTDVTASNDGTDG